MRVVSLAEIERFVRRRADADKHLRAWLESVREADWATPLDVKENFPTASILPNNRVVFRIRGNSYRIVAELFYPGRIVRIRFVGTHAEYDRINAREV